MFRRRSRESLQQRLDAIESAIAAHPLSSERNRRIEAIIRAGEGDKELISARLAEEGIPGLHRLGLFYLRNWPGWWWLHDRRRAATRRIERLRG